MRRKKKVNNNKAIFIIILMVIGGVSFIMSDFSPWSTFVVTGDATVDINYRDVSVGGTLIWSTVNEVVGEYWSNEGVDSLSIDADPLGAMAVVSTISRVNGFNPQVGSTFGTARGLYLTTGGEFVETTSVSPYDEFKVGGYKHFYYKMRFRMFVSTFGEVIPVTEVVDYVSENGTIISGLHIPTTKYQQMEYTMSVTTTLGDNYPSDSVFRVSDVVLSPQVDGTTHVISSEGLSGMQDILYDTYSDDDNLVLDKPYIIDYDDIKVDYFDNGDGILSDGTFTVSLIIASGAIFDESLNRWFLRDSNLFFDLDVGFEFIVNEYVDAKWSGTIIDNIIARIPDKFEISVFQTDPIWVVIVGVVLIASVAMPYYFLKRKVIKGNVHISPLLGN